MVVVNVLYVGDRAVGFYSEGHAGYSVEGNDICCAGVSVLTQTAALGLAHHLGREPHYQLEDGWLRCELPDDLSESEKELAHIILNTMEIGLAAMQEAYPRNVKLITQIKPAGLGKEGYSDV